MTGNPAQQHGSTPEDPLLAWRKEFPILERTNYLISNSLGAMPRATYDGMREYAETWATRGVRAWAEGWWELPVTFGDRVAELLHVPKGTVSMHQNVTIAEAVVLSCFPFEGKRTRIVYTDMQFPSVHYLYSEMKPKQAEVVLVPSPDGVVVPTQLVLDAIDERTLLVPISHVLFRSAYIQDARAIVEKAHRVGAHVVLDVYQSAGTVPLDLGALGVDFAVGGCLKWLCGGPGASFLYVRPDLARTLTPRFTGWQAHPEPFAFAVEPMRWKEGAYRFLHGTPNVPALYAARAGLEIVLEVGVERIRDKSIRQTARLLELAHAAGLKTTAPADPERRGGTVAVDCDHGYEVSRELIARDVLVDYRPKAGIRLSPHFYTSETELEHAIAQIVDILGSRAWERHAGEKGTVT